jgi:hypothetical protein
MPEESIGPEEETEEPLEGEEPSEKAEACFGLDDLGIIDIIGLFVIGGWMLSRSGQIIGTKGAKKAGGKIFKRLGLSFFGELIPYFGGIAPCWILAVYFELKSK